VGLHQKLSGEYNFGSESYIEKYFVWPTKQKWNS